MENSVSAMPAGLTERFSSFGVVVVEYALSATDLIAMDALFPALPSVSAGARASDFTPEAHDWLASHGGLADLARRLGGEATSRRAFRLTRVQAFDKSPSANWFVPWHQDRAEYGQDRPIPHLEQTIALRIHLDACEENNGPLEVIPGSHTLGRLDSPAIGALLKRNSPLLCLAVRGDIIALRPLLVHRSQRARIPASRRVLHLEYAPFNLTQ